MDQRRHLAGTPAGGRFAEQTHSPADDVALDQGNDPAGPYLRLRPGTAAAGSTVTLEGNNWMPSHTVTVGVIDEAAVTAFRNGQCHALALAPHERTGWPIVASGPSECCYDEDCPDTNDSAGVCDCQVQHLAVERPDGYLVDIEGARPRDDFLLASADPDFDEVRPLAPDHLERILWDSQSWREPDVAAARGFVDAVLAS